MASAATIHGQTLADQYIATETIQRQVPQALGAFLETRNKFAGIVIRKIKKEVDSNK